MKIKAISIKLVKILLFSGLHNPFKITVIGLYFLLAVKLRVDVSTHNKNHSQSKPKKICWWITSIVDFLIYRIMCAIWIFLRLLFVRQVH